VIVSILLVCAGLLVLVAGAELVVLGAARFATLLGIAPMVIGLTIVSVGTSAPELAIGVVAGLQDKGGLAVGNIAGTNLLNMLFILGLSALLRPLPLHLQFFKLELPVLVFASALMTFLAWDGLLSRWDGLLMLAVGIAYTVTLISMTRRASQAARKEFREEYGPQSVPQRATVRSRAWYLTILLVGIALTVLGAEVLVRGAVGLATLIGVSATTIGLTIVAFGTSAPELVTTIMSTIRDDRDVAVGNLLGSSIYNILFILSVPCMIAPGGLRVERDLLWCDIPLMAGVALGAIPVFLTGKSISRFEGGLAIAIYVVYMLWLIFLRN